jgi:branched-chain amino acid aminotransferase
VYNLIGGSKLSDFINFNGNILRSDTAILTADNRGFRYGDGLFETMKVVQGRLLLERYHFERLLSGIRLLQFGPSPSFTPEKLVVQVRDLCKINGHQALARVRLVVFREDGDLYDAVSHSPQYVIQSFPLSPQSSQLNEQGLVIDVFPDGRKSCDVLANLKSNNYLLYALAALYARGHQLNDCLVLNSHDRIADSTIANLFYCSQGKIYTPPLTEGCVAGVMRRRLLKVLPNAGYSVQEKETTRDDLEGAEEVFLTNALKGIKWVRSFGTATYDCQLITSMCRRLSDLDRQLPGI